MDASKFLELLKTVAEQLPSLIAMIACIGFAISRRRLYPKVALTVIAGLVLLILHIFIFNIIYTWVPNWFIKTDSYDPIKVRNFYLVLGLIANTFAAILTAILVAAVFMQRTRDSRRPGRNLVQP
jgi:hypothetical protein